MEIISMVIGIGSLILLAKTLKRLRCIMTQGEQVLAEAGEIKNLVQLVDEKLDEVKVYVAGLQPADITQEQLDQLTSMLSDIKSHTSAVVSEAGEIVPQPEPEPAPEG